MVYVCDKGERDVCDKGERDGGGGGGGGDEPTLKLQRGEPC